MSCEALLISWAAHIACAMDLENPWRGANSNSKSKPVKTFSKRPAPAARSKSVSPAPPPEVEQEVQSESDLNDDPEGAHSTTRRNSQTKKQVMK